MQLRRREGGKEGDSVVTNQGQVAAKEVRAATKEVRTTTKEVTYSRE